MYDSHAAGRDVLPRIPARVNDSPKNALARAARAAEAPDLKVVLAEIHRIDRSRKRWKHGFWAAGILLVVGTGAVFAAITATQNSYSGLFGETYDYNESLFSVTGKGMVVNALPASASGTTQGTAQEMALVLGAATTAISAGHWYYAVDVKEAAIAAVTSGTYKVELFVDETSQGALYIKQVTSDALNVEGVTCKWSLGASLNANAAYTLKITSV